MTAIYIKTEEEIEGFKHAGQETAKILSSIIYHAQPGWKPIELDKIAREKCEQIHAKPAFLGYQGFPAAICFSKNNVMVHGIPDSEPLRHGDLVSVDFGIDIDGFIGDSAVTFVIGDNKTKEQARLISECNFALYRAIKAAKEGNMLSDISREITKVAKSNKFQIPENYGGHGISKNIMHAPPFVPNIPTSVNDFTLRSGMLLAIEPMFISAASNGVRVASDKWAVIAEGLTAHSEHTVLVGREEGLALTDLKSC